MQELDTYRRSRGWALFVYSSLLIAVVYVCACPIVANINQKVKDKKTADKEAEMNAQIALLKRQIAAQEEKITAQQAEIERLNKGSNA